MQQLYATIKKSSKYADQQPRDGSKPIPFEVEVGDGPANEYIVYGNSNQYRIEDVRFYVKWGDRFIPLSK